MNGKMPAIAISLIVLLPEINGNHRPVEIHYGSQYTFYTLNISMLLSVYCLV